jgi:hypothetical protein
MEVPGDKEKPDINKKDFGRLKETKPKTLDYSRGWRHFSHKVMPQKEIQSKQEEMGQKKFPLRLKRWVGHRDNRQDKGERGPPFLRKNGQRKTKERQDPARPFLVQPPPHSQEDKKAGKQFGPPRHDHQFLNNDRMNSESSRDPKR